MGSRRRRGLLARGDGRVAAVSGPDISPDSQTVTGRNPASGVGGKSLSIVLITTINFITERKPLRNQLLIAIIASLPHYQCISPDQVLLKKWVRMNLKSKISYFGILWYLNNLVNF